MSDAFEPEERGDEMDVADQVSYEDTGRPWGARVINHPSHARTRAHFASNPLPTQQDRRTA